MSAITYDEVLRLFKETREQFKETREQFAETREQFKETDARLDKQFAETDARLDKRFAETDARLDKRFAETDARIAKLAKQVGGITANNGETAEAFFFNGLKNRSEVLGIPYGQVDSFHRKRGKLEGQYDIVLFNGDIMVVIEVKCRCHPGDIADFVERRLGKFRDLFPEYGDKKLVGGIAALSFPDESRIRAEKAGLVILGQSGEGMTVGNSEGFSWRTY